MGNRYLLDSLHDRYFLHYWWIFRFGDRTFVSLDPSRWCHRKIVFQILDKITSLFRAIPFIILLAFINPLTYLLLKNTIGPTAALVPLSLAVFPFFARQVQVVLSELDGGVIEAAQASGATFWA